MTTPGKKSAAHRKLLRSRLAGARAGLASRFRKWAAIAAYKVPDFLKVAAVVVPLAVFVLGVLLLLGVWRGPPVAAPFTRVGGASRVDTALEASRFWLTPPRYVVETETHARNLMLAAARCAVVHNAPLLFKSSDPKQNGPVRGRIRDWKKIDKSLQIITIYEHKGEQIFALDGNHDRKCPSNGPLIPIPDLSTVRHPLIPLKHVSSLRPLAPFIVFAAVIQPGHLPDVAVGLALAAHMAHKEGVSLIVVPHYLESDPGLEKELMDQHELVAGGVVLGQTPTVPGDTRELLRQLLTARNGANVLAQLQRDLGSAGSLIGALLAFGGLTAAIAGPGFIERATRNEGSRAVKFNWLSGLSKGKRVSIWLRSGRQVGGIVEDQIPPSPRPATALKIKKDTGPTVGFDSVPKYMLVLVEDIEQIDLIDP